MKLMIIGVALAGFAAVTPLSAQRPSGNQRTTRQNCTNTQGGSVSDVILGRRSASTVGCVDNRTNQRVNSRTSQQVNGGWYQVGNAGNGGTIYERQIQDQYGNVVVQRARRDRNGNMSIISTRTVGNNGGYNNGSYNNGSYNNGTYNNRRRSDGDGDNDDQGNYQNGRGNNGNHYGQYKNGKGHGKDKGNKHGDD
ncbi:MAG: hypothetical protein QOD47_1767 [Gemmatimonadaceae bacterium]|jgi:hypothetical protein|nr:hypothetical protein [Gemmatimonadaceae bacterium]